MKKALSIFIILLCVCLASGCGPGRHAIHVEMRHPSKSGLELGGKIVSVAWTVSGDASSDTFTEGVADAFAKAIEKDYGTGEGSVGVYEVDAKSGDYTQKDSLVNILMSTGADMVFLFGPMKIERKSTGGIPVQVNLYCFDGMNKEENVFSFKGNTVIASSGKDGLAAEASETGKRVAETFASQWKHEQYSIAYYDSPRWYEALEKAEMYDWKGAMDIWFTFLDSSDVMKKASAEYNIAVACYMLGDFALADEWLKKSMADNDMPTLTDAMRKRIDARK